MTKFKVNTDIIDDNQIRIIGAGDRKTAEGRDDAGKNGGKKPGGQRGWLWLALLALIAIVAVAVCYIVFHKKKEQEKPVAVQKVTTAKTTEKPYVAIEDTMVADISLHRFTPVNGKPKLVVGVMKEIPEEYVLGAMAADFGEDRGKERIAGAFVLKGEMINYSKSKYGFCAILKDSVILGNALSTEYFERSIEEQGYFFRQYPLVKDGEAVENPTVKSRSLRRSLCKMRDGTLCIIETDMAVYIEDFSKALCQYGVQDAISLVGTGAAVRWATDKDGHRYISGADEFDYPNVVNYIVWV